MRFDTRDKKVAQVWAGIAFVLGVLFITCLVSAIIFCAKWMNAEERLQEQKPLLVAIENKQDLASPCELNKDLCGVWED